jgi:peptidoglycan hydrolase-like protein with peptidoglycan-binding domain
MALSKELEAEFKKLQFAIGKFMEIHNNPHDTSKHNEVAEKLTEFDGFLSSAKNSTAENKSATTSTEETSTSPSGRRSISASVGKGAVNKEEDVQTIQELLNENGYSLEADGKIGNKTISAIKRFQGRLGMRADGVVSPGKNTMKGLLGELPAGPMSTGISAIIQGGESGAEGYNAYNRGTQGNTILGPNGSRSLITMTLAQIMADQKRPKSDPQTLFAVGKYQMIPTTLKEGVQVLNLDHSTKFDATTQEYLFSDYLLGAKRSQIRAYVQGTGSAQEAGIAGAKEWASIADPRTGKSYYDGSGGNSAHITAEDFLASLDEAKEEYKKNIAAGMEPAAAYRKAMTGVGDEGDSGTDTNTDSTTDTGSGNNDTTDTTGDTTTTQDTINKSVGKGGVNAAADVQLVQELLNKKGESLTVDGKIGNNTINAIKRFQATLNIGAPDGLIEPGKSTMAALVGGSSTDTTDTTDTTGDTTTTQDTIDKSVGKGGVNAAADVQLVQELLNKKGESLTVDGKIGNNTINAIKRFQATLNMGAPDGLIEPGKSTMAALVGGSTSEVPSTPSTPGAEPTETTDTTETEDTPDTAGETTEELAGPYSGETSIQASVGRDATNNEADVRVIQELLVHNGEEVKVDGKIGSNTIAAIESIQYRLKVANPDGVVDPDKNTHKALIAGNVPAAEKPSGNYFSHPGANAVKLKYGSNAVKMNATAEHLLKSILAASGNTSAKVNSTLRTYYHQARVMIQYYTVDEMARLYKNGSALAAGRRAAGDDIQKFADFLEDRDKKNGTLISKHVPGKAIDVVPEQSRTAYVAKAEALISVSGSGVSHFIRLGQFGEKVDHIEFTFRVV